MLAPFGLLVSSLPQADHEFASQLGGSVHALHDGRDDAVASQLQRIIIGANAAEQVAKAIEQAKQAEQQAQQAKQDAAQGLFQRP